MGLLDEIAAQTRGIGPQCTMRAVIERLPAKDRDDLAAALADRSIPTRAIFRALKARDPKVTESGVGRHRKGDCACGKP